MSIPTTATPIITPEQAEAIRGRRGFATDYLIAATTNGGTYILASSGKLNDSNLPRDLLAILPGDLGQGRVLALYIAVSPGLIAEVEAIIAAEKVAAPSSGDRAPMYGGRDENGL